jgi:GAF domain-containing protein
VPGGDYLEIVAEYNSPGYPQRRRQPHSHRGQPPHPAHPRHRLSPSSSPTSPATRCSTPCATSWKLRQVASILLLPITAGDRVVGTLGIDSRTVRTFSPDEIALAASATTAAAQVLDKARLLEAEQRNAARLEDILALSIELAALPGEQELLQHLVRPRRRHRRLAHLHRLRRRRPGRRRHPRRPARRARRRRAPPPARYTPAAVKPSPTTSSSSPTSTATPPQLRQLLVRSDLHSFQAYPMVSQGEMLGFLTIGRTTPYQPSPAEVNAFRLLAERAGAALRSARLLQRMQQQTAHLSALHNVQLAVSTSLDPELVYRTIVGHAAELVNCDARQAPALG